jgi:hypothetical protein
MIINYEDQFSIDVEVTAPNEDHIYGIGATYNPEFHVVSVMDLETGDKEDADSRDYSDSIDLPDAVYHEGFVDLLIEQGKKEGFE